jgi:predicted patatin/cPLA2 family phospholipase
MNTGEIMGYVIDGLFMIIMFFVANSVKATNSDLKDNAKAIADIRVEMEKKVHQDEWRKTMDQIFEEFKQLREIMHTKADRRTDQ